VDMCVFLIFQLLLSQTRILMQFPTNPSYGGTGSQPLFSGQFSWFDHSKFGDQVYKPQQPQLQPKKQTKDPIVRGTSILGIKYKDGVMISGDTLLSYGSLARFRDIQRIRPVGTETLIGGSGEYSDYIEVMRILQEQQVQDEMKEDGTTLPPWAIHSYLTRILYQARNKFDPLWGEFVIGGFRNGKSYLGVADLHGTAYQDTTIATGYGNHIARPLLREFFSTRNNDPSQVTYDEAKTLMETCLRVLFYRDARALNRIQIATVTAEGVTISEPYELSTDWSSGIINYPGVKNIPIVQEDYNQYANKNANNNNLNNNNIIKI